MGTLKTYVLSVTLFRPSWKTERLSRLPCCNYCSTDSVLLQTRGTATLKHCIILRALLEWTYSYTPVILLQYLLAIAALLWRTSVCSCLGVFLCSIVTMLKGKSEAINLVHCVGSTVTFLQWALWQLSWCSLILPSSIMAIDYRRSFMGALLSYTVILLKEHCTYNDIFIYWYVFYIVIFFYIFGLFYFLIVFNIHTYFFIVITLFKC